MSKNLVKITSENQIVKLAKTYAERVEDLKITSREKFVEMAGIISDAKLWIKAIEEYFEPIRQPAYDSLQAIYGKINEAKKPFQSAEKIGKQRMKGWEQIEATRAREAEAKQRAAIAAAEAKQRAAAEEAKANGAPPPVFSPPPVAKPVENKAKTLVKGVQFVDNWKGRVTDTRELLKAILTEKAPKNFIVANTSKIYDFAQSTSGKVAVPGIEWYNDKTVKVGRK